MNQGHVEIKGSKVYYQMLNEEYKSNGKPWLLFLHDGLGCSDSWKNIPELMSRETQCPALLYDRAGYGKSDAVEKHKTSEYLFDEAYECLPQLLDSLEIEGKVLPIGHSDGGTIALLFASKYPEKVKALITEADHVILEEITYNGISDAANDFINGDFNVLYKFHGDKTDELVKNWTGTWKAESKNWSIADHLSGITAPTLCIQGKEDQFGTAEQISVKLKNISGSVEVLYLDNCGHIPHHQAREKVFRKIRNFIVENS